MKRRRFATPGEDAEAAANAAATRTELEWLRALSPNLAKQELPVVVVEEHTEALAVIHRATRRRLLPLRDVAMLHFDSHPDLVVSPTLPAELVMASPARTMEFLRSSEAGIAEWIMPAMYSGQLGRVAWIRPPWSHQIPDGCHDCVLGDVATPDGDRIRTSCHEPYWLYEGASCPAAEIRNPQHCTIDVASLPAGWRHDAAPDAPEIRAVLARICGGDNTRSRDIGGGTSGEVGADCEAGAAGATGATAAPAPAWVLDICLDYFSTGNPFFDRLRRALPAPGDVAAVAAAYGHIARGGGSGALFEFIFNEQVWDSDPDDPAAPGQLKVQALVARLRVRWQRDRTKIPGSDPSAATEPHAAVCAFLALLRRLSPEQRLAVREEGPMAGLPHHVTSRSQMRAMLADLRQCLAAAAALSRPRFVTVACSVADEYTPRSAVAWLLAEVLKVIKATFGEIKMLMDDDVELEV